MWINYLKKFGIIAEFFIVLLEYACFPIPSEVVLPFAGAMSVTCSISIVLIILISIIAGILGSIICYYIGYFGTKKIINKISKKDGFKESLVKYQKYSNASVCIGRIIPLCRTYISFVAGMSHQPIKQYIFYSSIGITIWNTCLITLGYFFFSLLLLNQLYLENIKKYNKKLMLCKCFLLKNIAISFRKGYNEENS